MINLIAYLLIVVIKFYKYLISPLLGTKCRFLPTCSEYFIEALNEHGLTAGLSLGIKRIFKCHPIKKLGGSNGIDFVPASRNSRKKIKQKKKFKNIKTNVWKLEGNKEV